MKFGVLVFPGSNCDHDTYNVIAEIAHQPVTFLWHDSEDLAGVDAIQSPRVFVHSLADYPNHVLEREGLLRSDGHLLRIIGKRQ